MPTCCVCGYSCHRRNRSIPLHRFPKNSDSSGKWREWCLEYGVIKEDDNIRNAYICRIHFPKTNYRIKNQALLKPSAVPSIYKGIPIASHFPQSLPANASDEQLHADASTSPTPTKPRRTRNGIPIPSHFPQSVPANTSDEQLHANASTSPTPTKPGRTENGIPILSTFPQFLPGPDAVDDPFDVGASISHTLTKPHRTRKRYIGDFTPEDMADVVQAKKLRKIALKMHESITKRNMALKQRNRRLIQKIKSFESLMSNLKTRHLLTGEAVDQILDEVPPIIRAVITRKLNKKKTKQDRKYNEEIRKFALTIQYYSDKAYQHVRKYFHNLLPHPRTIRRWYYAINGAAGFTKQSFEAIKRNFLDKGKPFLCNLVVDDMKLTEELIWVKDRFYGQVDMGTGLTSQHEDAQMASYAFVMMAVGLNTQYKIPLGYFLIRSMSGEARGNLLRKCIVLLHENGATVTSVTFDGAPSNFSTAHHLGARTDPTKENFNPTFEHPITREKIFIFPDPCHMLKLCRNVLGDQKTLLNSNNEKIQWNYIETLVGLQEREGLRAANKLGPRHIKYQNNKMSVKLAAQVLSQSTCDSLNYLRSQNYINFKDSEATSIFCQQINNIFDFLNCKSKFSKLQFSRPVNEDSKHDLQEKANDLVEYLKGLQHCSGVKLIDSARKTGPVGFIICLQNMFALYENYHSKGLDYFLTFKISQDFVETFFSALRSRGGWNLYPNVMQFQSAYKRLLVKNQINAMAHGNCETDGSEILTLTSSNKSKTCVRGESAEDLINVLSRESHQFNPIGLDDDLEEDNLNIHLSNFVEDIAKYIAGFIVGKLKSRNLVTCECCLNSIISGKQSSLHISNLSRLKDRGTYLIPSENVVKICVALEKIFRASQHEFLIQTDQKLKDRLSCKLLRSIQVPFNTEEMNQHVLSQTFLDNHRMQLTKLIINYYLKIRLHHFASLQSKKKRKHEAKILQFSKIFRAIKYVGFIRFSQVQIHLKRIVIFFIDIYFFEL